MVAEPLALKVYFEVTGYCNFRCDFCPLSGESVRPVQHMDYALYRKGIDEIAAQGITTTVGYHVLGEPLMYPRLDEAIAYAKANGLRTEVNANGSLLTPDRVRRLVDAGLDQIAVSVQILDREAHECRGAAIPYDAYYQRVMDATRLFTELSPHIEVILCAMNTSTRRFFDIDKAIGSNGSAGDFRAKLPGYFMDIYDALGQHPPRREVEASVRRLNINRPQYVRLSEQVRVYVQPLADWGNAFTGRRVYPARIGACGYALENIGVLTTGEVTICCADYDGHTSLGNLNQQPLAAILTSEKANAIREGFAHNRVVDPYCQRCIGSTNPVKAMLKGLGSIYLFKWLKFQPSQAREIPLLPEATHSTPPVRDQQPSGELDRAGQGAD
jgi:sulfatase maturation enzyme AslB (radical SAM superfamily)